MEDTYSAALVALFADPIFDPQRELDARARDTLTYEQVRHLNAGLGLTARKPLLLRDHGQVRSFLELAAMVSPSTFIASLLHHSMSTGAVIDFGTDIDALAELEADGSVGCIMMTEFGYGSSSANLLTEAHYDPLADEFVINTPNPMATKFPSNVGAEDVPKWAVVSARLKIEGVDRGAFLFLFKLRDKDGPCPGVRIKNVQAFPHLQLDYGSTVFTEVRVPRSGWLADGSTIAGDGVFHDPLADPGLRTRRTVEVSRFGCGSACLGLAAAARASLAIAVPHAYRRAANSREGATVPVIRYRNQQTLLLTAMASAFAADAVARRTSVMCMRVSRDRGRGQGLTPAEFRGATLAKVGVGRLAERTIVRVRATCGNFGFMAVNRLIEYHNLVLVFQPGGGDNQLILLAAAREMIAGVDYEAPTVGTTTAAGDGGLAHGVDLLRRRERGLHGELVEGLGEAAERGDDSFTAWNDEVDLAEEFAVAHLTRTMAETFLDQADNAADPGKRDLLLALCELYVCEEITNHQGWYLAAGLLTPAQSRNLRGTKRELCDRLLPDMETLVQMLEIPVSLLRSPLGSEKFIDEILPA